MIRKIFREAKGSKLIKTIVVMDFIARVVPTGDWAWVQPLSSASGQRSRKSEILLRFRKIGLETQRGFVMPDRRLVFLKPVEDIGQFLMSDGLIRLQGKTVLISCPRFLGA